MFTKILVPWDGTPEAGIALTPALTLARGTGSSVAIVRCVSPGDELALAAAREGVDRLKAELADTGVTVETVVRTGDAADEILAEVVRVGAGLIVMATHGRSGIARVMMGSVAQHVLTHSPVPVLLQRPGGRKVTALHTLLVPVDGTPGAALALGTATSLARAVGARIVLVDVVVPFYAYAAPGWSEPDGGVFLDPAWEQASLRAAEGYVDDLALRLRREGVNAEGYARIGATSRTIEAIADEVDADLILMSTHALTGPIRTILGSVADELVRESRRGVLLVRRDMVPLPAAGADRQVSAA